jgi:hypothetical protein
VGAGVDLPVMWVMFSTGKCMRPSLLLITQRTLKTCEHICTGSSQAPVISVVPKKIETDIPREECPFGCAVNCIHHI